MERPDPRLEWRLTQAFLHLLARIANSKAASRERLIESRPADEIVEVGGRRWRITYGPARDRDGDPARTATPLD